MAKRSGEEGLPLVGPARPDAEAQGAGFAARRVLGVWPPLALALAASSLLAVGLVLRQRAARGVEERFAGRVELGCGHTACAYRARDTERGIDVVLKARGVEERFAGRVELGCGFTACAYRARDTERGIDVVLKVALQFEDVETSRGWLESECSALKSLQASSDGTEASERRSGRIIQCYEDHTKENPPFIVLESWGTQTLERYFRAWVGSEKRMPARIAQSLWTQIQEGLAYMSDRNHKCQWIHGDLHFKNIMVDTSNQDEPTLKIIDFGLASTEQEGDEERQPCKDAQTVAQNWRSWFEVKPHHVGLDPADTKEKSTNMFGLLEACAGDPSLCPAPAHWLTTAMALEGTADVRPPPSTRVFQSPLEKAGYCPK